MCNNNGHCRKFDAGTMCPSYRVTRDEQHLTRGRANTLRLALSGQLGPDALTGKAMYETMALCVSCKGCRRECPTGVDMARMKVEFLIAYKARHGFTLKDRLIAHLPDYAAAASRFAWLPNLRDTTAGSGLAERKAGRPVRAAHAAEMAARHFLEIARSGVVLQPRDETVGGRRRQGGASVRRYLQRQFRKRKCRSPRPGC